MNIIDLLNSIDENNRICIDNSPCPSCHGIEKEFVIRNAHNIASRDGNVGHCCPTVKQLKEILTMTLNCQK